MPFSSTISTYGANNTNITQSSTQVNTLANLHAGFYRIPLQWNGGNIISSAGGGPAGISGDAWIKKIQQFGQPEIVLGGSGDDNFTAADAANMVQHFNKPVTGPANPVTLWVIGNEPDRAGMSIQTYCTLFNSVVTAMKAIDPTIKVAGPAWSHFDANVLAAFLQCAGSNVDVLDFHEYAMGQNSLDTATALSQTANYSADVSHAYQLIQQYVPSRTSQIQVQIGEYNWSWQTADGYNGWQGDDRFYSAINTVWGASVAGHIAAAGGRGDEYADLNGALGLTFEQTDAAARYGQSLSSPMPIYYGLEMFTGGNLFRGFGTSEVSAQTSLPNVEVYAANNGNIVLINKDPAATQIATVGLNGFAGGSADVWQTNANAPFSQPVHQGTITGVTGTLSYSLPPYSVTTLVLNGGVSGGTGGGSSGGGGTPGGGGTGGGTGTPPPLAVNNCTAVGVQAGTAAGQFTFTPAATTNGKVTLASYSYDFGDGSAQATTTLPSLTHVFARGTYTVHVSVNFSVGGQSIEVDFPGCQATVTASTVPPTGGTGSGGTVTVPPPPTGLLTAPVRINAGGGAYTDPSGNAWSADMDYVGGSTDNQGVGHAIAGTNMAPLFQYERYGNFNYQLPIANGSYTVRLYFAETYAGCLAVGCRVFDVTANGKPVLTNFDEAAKVGDYTADIETATVTVTNNMLNLAFTGVVGSPQVSAIEVLNS